MSVAKVTIDVSKLAELVKAAVGPKSAAKAPAAKEPKEKKEKAAPKKKEKSAVVEVEKIVGMRAGAKGLEYRIKWEGFSDERSCSWVLASQLRGTAGFDEALRTFERAAESDPLRV